MLETAINNPDEQTIKDILAAKPVIAMVGLSPKTDRDSHRVAKYLLENGYKVIPVHPQAEEILGQKAYPTLADIPEKVDLVDVFRKPEAMPPIAQAAVDKGAGVLWMQLGIRNDEAAALAAEAGLTVVQDLCMKIEHHRLLATP